MTTSLNSSNPWSSDNLSKSFLASAAPWPPAEHNIVHDTITVIFVFSFNKRLVADGRGLQEESDGYYAGNATVSVSSTVSPSVVVLAREGACGNLALEIWYTRLRQWKPMVVAE
ncbi:hypothetical protein GYH30_047656 [Glycine max]|nr:hypothetical protein GYH30_047656 [Glycine max]